MRHGTVLAAVLVSAALVTAACTSKPAAPQSTASRQPSSSITVNYFPDHPPSNQDVSTTTPGQRFYAVPNFHFFQGCGRPCWLPLFQIPTEQGGAVTRGWPCEFYDAGSGASGPYCLNADLFPRKPTEMADPGNKLSGDRVLVICQTRRDTQSLRDEHGNVSAIWDAIAVPQVAVVEDPAIRLALQPVPGMPGYFLAYGGDIWLGNTGWHHIPCGQN